MVAGVHPGTGAPYVLSRRVASLADIPLVELEQFKRIIEGVIAEMQAAWMGAGLWRRRDWTGNLPRRWAAKADPANFEEVAWILERLPNRDVESGKETEWDKFISVYEEWIKVLYAIFGALGDASEARTLAVDWANGRAQTGQTAESAWASVVKQDGPLGHRPLKAARAALHRR